MLYTESDDIIIVAEVFAFVLKTCAVDLH